jgi:hypothetical protein
MDQGSKKLTKGADVAGDDDASTFTPSKATGARDETPRTDSKRCVVCGGSEGASVSEAGDADRVASTGTAVRGITCCGSGATAEAAGGVVRSGTAGARGDRRGGDDGALRAHRWLRARGGAAELEARHRGGDALVAERDGGADRALPFGRTRALDAGGGVAARAPRGARGSDARGDRAAPVPHEELGVTPAGATQDAHGRNASQGRDGAGPAAGGDEVSAAVGPGQRRARAEVGRGARRTPDLSPTNGAAVYGLARGRCNRAGAPRDFPAAVPANGGRSPAPSAEASARDRATHSGLRRRRRHLWARHPSRAQRNHSRRDRIRTQADLGRMGHGTRSVCGRRRGDRREARGA